MAGGGSLGRLYYELEARTEKLESGLNSAERRMERFAGVVKRAPVAALGAFASVAAIVAVKVAFMADQIDQKMRRVNTILGGTREQIDGLRRGVVQLSRETPHTADQLAEGLERIVTLGERDPGRAFNLLRDAARGATVTGQGLLPVIDQLDSILDNFEGRKAPEVLDLLARAGTQGAPARDVAALVSELAPRAAAARVPLEELVATVTTLLNRLSPEQASRALKATFGGLATDAENADSQLNKLGGTVAIVNGHIQVGGVFAGDYRRQLDGLAGSAGEATRQERELNGSLEAQVQLMQNQLNAALLELGSKTLPAVTTAVRALNGMFAILDGTIGRIRANTAATTLQVLADNLDNLDPDQRAQALDRMRDSLEALIRGGRGLSQLTTEQLEAAEAGLSALVQNGMAARGRSVSGTVGMLTSVRARLAGRTRTPATPTETPTPTPTTVPLTDEQRGVAEQVRQAVAALTTGMVAEAERSLEELRRRVQEKFGDQLPADVAAGLARLRADVENVRIAADFTEVLEENEQRIQKMNDAGRVGTREWERQRAGLEQNVDALERMVGETEENTAEHDRLNGLLERGRGLLRQMQAAEEGKTDAARKGADQAERSLDAMREYARTIEGAVRGALQLANAMGLVDDESADALTNLTQVAANMGPALETLRQFRAGKEGVGAGDLVGAFLPVVGGIAQLIGSAFGDSPEDQRRREVLQQNNERLAELTRKLGDFGLRITGSQFSGVRSAVGAVAQGLGGGRPIDGLVGRVTTDAIGAALGGELGRLGLSMADLRTVAEQLGISFAAAVPNAQELEQLARALAATELTRFAETFQGQMDLLQASADALDLDDPIAALQKMGEIASRFSPAFQGALAGLDLSTAEGRAEAERRLEALFGQLAAGTLTPEQLGNMTPEEFLRALLDLEKALDEQDAPGSGKATSFAIDRTITEVTASRIGSLLSTSVLFEEQTARNTALIASILAGPRAGVVPPTWDELNRFTGQGSGVSVVVNVTVQLAGGGAAEAEMAGKAIGAETVKAIDKALGERQRAQARANGAVIFN